MMMVDVITKCRSNGIKLESSGEDLKLVGPKSAITADLTESIKRYKPEILSVLEKVERCKEIVHILDSNTLTHEQVKQLVDEASALWEQIPREMLPDLED